MLQYRDDGTPFEVDEGYEMFRYLPPQEFDLQSASQYTEPWLADEQEELDEDGTPQWNHIAGEPWLADEPEEPDEDSDLDDEEDDGSDTDEYDSDLDDEWDSDLDEDDGE